MMDARMHLRIFPRSRQAITGSRSTSSHFLICVNFLMCVNRHQHIMGVVSSSRAGSIRMSQ